MTEHAQPSDRFLALHRPGTPLLMPAEIAAATPLDLTRQHPL